MDRTPDNSPDTASHPGADPVSDFVAGLWKALDSGARVAAAPKVYPMYLASRIKAALKLPDPDMAAGHHILESVGDIETIGDCRYRLSATDHNGTRYRITVEVGR